MLHIRAVSGRLIAGADFESSAQPLASLRRREILPFHHAVDIISTPPARNAMTSVGGCPDMQTRIYIIMNDKKGVMVILIQN